MAAGFFVIGPLRPGESTNLGQTESEQSMQFTPEGPMAIPLWINGHAFLTAADRFFDVVDPARGEAIRRVPLCGAAEAAEAVAAAAAAAPAWAALAPAERRERLAALADALEGYAEHFAKLLGQETGRVPADGLGDVQAAVAALRSPGAGAAELLVAVADDGRPLAALAELAAPVLAAGGTVVLKPSPRAPGAAYALCELTARTGWPGGVVNLVQGDEEAIDGLCAQATVSRLAFAGGAALAERIAAVAARHGKAFSAA